MKIAVLSAALVSQLAITAQEVPVNVQVELKKLDETFLAAVLKKDEGFLNTLVSPGFWWVSPGGKMVGKTERISQIMARSNPINSLVTIERNVTQVGDMFRVDGIYEVTGRVSNRSLFASYRFVRLYQKQPKGWQLMTEQEVQRGVETIRK